VSIQTLYNKSATISRRTLAATSYGAAQKPTWSNHLTTVACAVQPLTAREMEAFGKLTGEVTHRMFTAAGQDILPRDRVVVGSTTYEIEGSVDAAGRSHHMELLVHEWVES